MTTRVALVDIEGTIGDAAFVKTVLFPYARERVEAYLRAHEAEPEVSALVGEAAVLGGRPGLDPAQAAALFRSWIDEDRKAPPLKALQGMIWREGYEAGTLTAHLYDDALVRLRAWAAAGVPLWVYSSGSVQAQELYFRYSVAGDVRSLFRGFFDTRIGPKVEASSYRRIAEAIGVVPAEILFLSDLAAEIVAAREAGVVTVRIDRAAPASAHLSSDELGQVASSFDALTDALKPWSSTS